MQQQREEDWRRFMSPDYFRVKKPDEEKAPKPQTHIKMRRSGGDPMPIEKRLETVIDAVRNKGCGDIPEISAEIKISPRRTSFYVRALIEEGLLVRHGLRNSKISFKG